MLKQSADKRYSYVFFGNSYFSLTVLQTLSARLCKPKTVVAPYKSPVHQWALGHDIDCCIYSKNQFTRLKNDLKKYKSELFIVAGFDILPESIFTLPKYGTINLHPSLLPKYRGARPVQAQILNNDWKNLGVTIHLVDELVDHGEIVAQEKISPIDLPMAANQLGGILAVAGGNLLAKTVPHWINQTLNPKKQNHSISTNADEIVPKKACELDFADETDSLYKKFLALGSHPGVYFVLHNETSEPIRVFISHAYWRNNSLVIAKVSLEKGESMSYQEFLEKYNLTSDDSWHKFSAVYNTNVPAGIDKRSPDVLIRLREEIFQNAIIKSSERKIVESYGNEKTDSWLMDLRAITMKPGQLDLIAELFWKKFGNLYPFQIGGQETAAIPLVTAIAMKGQQLEKPVNAFFVRKERKSAGLQKVIEGTLTNEKIILVDDLMNYGSTQFRQVELLESEDYKIHSIFALTRFRDLFFYNGLLERGIEIESLFTLDQFGLQASLPVGKNFKMQSNFAVKWKFASKDPNLFYIVPKSSPTIDKEKIYFGSDNGTFWALNQNDGEVAWKFKIWRTVDNKAIFSSPILHKDMVFFGAYDGNVYALNTKTGKKVWDFWEADWIGSSPEIAPSLNLLFVGLEFGLLKKRGGVVALDIQTGKRKWQYNMPDLTHATPAYSKKFNVTGIGCNDGIFRMFNAKTGALLWEFKTQDDIKYKAAFDEKRGYVSFGSMDGSLYTCHIMTGNLVNKFQTEGQIYSTPLITADSVYVASCDQRIYCLSLDNFSEQWCFEAGGKVISSPAMFNEQIYFGSNDGFMYELDMQGRMTDFFFAGERIVNSVSYNTDSQTYFLPTHANEIFCLHKRKNDKPV